MGGFGSQILRAVNEMNLDIKVKIFGIPDKFVSHGKTTKLYEHIGLTGEKLFEHLMNYYDKF